jgi:hypothetical protein
MGYCTGRRFCITDNTYSTQTDLGFYIGNRSTARELWRRLACIPE